MNNEVLFKFANSSLRDKLVDDELFNKESLNNYLAHIVDEDKILMIDKSNDKLNDSVNVLLEFLKFHINRVNGFKHLILTTDNNSNYSGIVDKFLNLQVKVEDKRQYD